MKVAPMPPVHPAAALFPMLPDDELKALADDIKTNGLQQPCVMFGAQLLDGRNRWRACEIAGVEPRVRDWSGTDEQAWAFAISINVKRRHLDESQRAMIAARIATMRAGRPKENSPIGLIPTQEQAAEMLSVGVSSIKRAKEVLEKADEKLIEAVEAGKVKVSTAAILSRTDKETQRRIAEQDDAQQAVAVAREIRIQKAQEIEVIRDRTLNTVRLEDAIKGKFQVIYADPPWQYSNTGFDGSAEGQYPTMATDDICAMPVGERAATNSVLLMWATWPLLKDALRVMEAWGFEYKTGAPWKKNVHVGGFYFLGITEFILVGVRGSCLPKKAPIGWFDYPRGKHSAKPHEFYDLIEGMYDGPYLELFARNQRPNWTSFGNDPAVAKKAG
jgi:N6-adenosine-specific RNA methylase IME4/ParB-like chromosome segregation protein Spo0J